MTLKTAGSQTVTATDTVTATITGRSSVKVSAAAVDHLKLTAVAGITAGVAFRITVTAQDAFNNTVTGYSGTVHFTSSDGQAGLPDDYAFTSTDKGVHTFSSVILRTAGTQTVTATDTATASVAGSAGIKVTAARAASLRISAPASVAHGVPFTFTATVLDAFGNVVSQTMRYQERERLAWITNWITTNPGKVLPKEPKYKKPPGGLTEGDLIAFYYLLNAVAQAAGDIGSIASISPAACATAFSR